MNLPFAQEYSVPVAVFLLVTFPLWAPCLLLVCGTFAAADWLQLWKDGHE